MPTGDRTMTVVGITPDNAVLGHPLVTTLSTLTGGGYPESDNFLLIARSPEADQHLVGTRLEQVIAVLGIVNTLALSVIERTRELGLLRAIGVSRVQVRAMVTLESVVISVLGALLGVGTGTIFGITLMRSLREEGLGVDVLSAIATE